MKPVSKTTQLWILSVFALVLLITGSVVVNMFVTAPASTRTAWGFHLAIGIISLLSGLVCIGLTIYVGITTETGQNLRKAVVENIDRKKRQG
jgi:bacteriorhodopsin